MTTKTNNDNHTLESLGLDNRTPFTVPEGYFDTLTKRVMENIEREEKETSNAGKTMGTGSRRKELLTYIARWTSVAAACILIAFVGFHYFTPETEHMAQIQPGTEEYDEEFGEDMMSYSMMDGQDVYCYLSGIE